VPIPAIQTVARAAASKAWRWFMKISYKQQ